jgi:hypothetical protein
MFNPLRPDRPPGGDSPDILRMAKPEPVRTRIIRHLHAGQWITALLRFWRPEEIARCRLCEKGRCMAIDDTCMFVIIGYISDEDAPLYSIVGARRQDGKGGYR